MPDRPEADSNTAEQKNPVTSSLCGDRDRVIIQNGIYLDHAAAMPPDPAVLARIAELFQTVYANQESPGFHGSQALHIQKKAEQLLKCALSENCNSECMVLWCSSGTEAVQASMKLIQKVYPSGGVILFSEGEHASVRAALKEMPGSYQCLPLKLASEGTLDLDDLEQKLKKFNVIACAVHFVQSETGKIQDLTAVRNLLKKHSSKALFFTDAIQGIGKIPLPWDQAKPDILTISGQKFGLPSGAALVCSNTLRKDLVSLRNTFHLVGRLPVPFAMALAERLEYLQRNLNENRKKASEIKNFLLQELQENLSGYFQETIPSSDVSDYICHLLLKSSSVTYQGAIVVRALSARGISVSSGSACDAETKTPSAVLRAMGIPVKDAYSALRISLGFHTTK